MLPRSAYESMNVRLFVCMRHGEQPPTLLQADAAEGRPRAVPYGRIRCEQTNMFLGSLFPFLSLPFLSQMHHLKGVSLLFIKVSSNVHASVITF